MGGLIRETSEICSCKDGREALEKVAHGPGPCQLILVRNTHDPPHHTIYVAAIVRTTGQPLRPRVDLCDERSESEWR